MELKKSLKTYDVFSLAAGAMISSGLFILPSVAYKEAGSWAILSYFLAGILMIPALISQLELATALPKAGGTYFYIERILGSSSGMAAGFANWFSIALKSALALVGIGFFANLIFPNLTPFQLKLISAGACVLFSLINIFSAESAGHSQGILVVVLLIILTQFVLVGYREADLNLIVQGAQVFDWGSIISVTGMVFISYGGLTKVASVAEEVKDPGKSLVRGSFIAFLIVQSLYVLIVTIISGVLSGEEFSLSLAPLSDAAQKIFTNPIIKWTEVILLSLAAIIAFITTANAGIMAASRVPLAMSRDKMLPKVMGRVSKRGTPVNSILFTSIFILILIFALDLKDLAKIASLFMLLLFILVNISVIVIRKTNMSNYRPTFKSPFFPLLQIIGVIFYTVLILNMGIKPIITAIIFLFVSVLWYYIFVNKHVNRTSALVYMIERVAKKEILTSMEDLEEELLGILLERDEVKEDRFSNIIRQSIVLDFNKELNRDELFSEISKEVSKRWSIDADKFMKKLNIRENDSETLVYPGVAVPHAIPHVIVEGENIFDILLVRDKNGIIWNDEGTIVHTVFCLIGSKDERDFHLKALMSIAQILQSPGFIEDWENAETPEELRTVMLLAKRRFLEV
ncbi:amino acid permease [Thiospirochaeta perfilievii]|uniref:Amino acid permease n=1 Tax=Thiospirochaeta perfilievii TaxID=252967 RepID=A0A5C1Q907_9SPIO|nr:amino acid permease [Thiospirochaeta perfilievii]QEN03991.1 amino acid permease [Thiospirochaeta perfilievii]